MQQVRALEDEYGIQLVVAQGAQMKLTEDGRLLVEMAAPLVEHFEKQGKLPNPMQRVGECEADVGRFIATLCSDDSRYINGQSIAVDGGQAYLG